MSNPVQRQTFNYDLFENHHENRLLADGAHVKLRRDLVASMRVHGFKKMCPIVCEKISGSRMRIVDGHNRLMAAIHLGIAVEYICYDKSETFNPTEFSSTQKQWSLENYSTTYSHNAETPDYLEVVEYSRETGIPLSACYSMFAGETVGSNNQIARVKMGKFKVKDREYPAVVKLIIDELNSHCDFGSSINMVNAVSKVVRIDGFDSNKMQNRIRTYPELLTKKRTVEEYIDLLDLIYNRNSKSEKLYFRSGVEKAMKARRIMKKDA